MTVRCAPSRSMTLSGRWRLSRRWWLPKRRSTRRSDRLWHKAPPCASERGSDSLPPTARHVPNGWRRGLLSFALRAWRRDPRPSWRSDGQAGGLSHLHLSRRRQGAIDPLDGLELRFPERLRFHLLQVGMGIAETRPDLFLVSKQAFLF